MPRNRSDTGNAALTISIRDHIIVSDDDFRSGAAMVRVLRAWLDSGEITRAEFLAACDAAVEVEAVRQ